MALDVKTNTLQRQVITLKPDGKLDGPAGGQVTIEVISGGGTLIYDPVVNPLQFRVVSEDVAGTSTYRMTALSKGNKLEDIVTYTYELPAPPEEPAATALNPEAGPIEDK